MKDPHWRQSSLCAQTDPEAFFPDKFNDAALQAARAKAICARCPVIEDCLDDVIATRDMEYGVRAGMSVNERKKLLTKRGQTAA